MQRNDGAGEYLFLLLTCESAVTITAERAIAPNSFIARGDLQKPS